MLRSLHIKNYILIDSLEVNFPEGLVIITGQTGAGKSILLGALALASGSKADASYISEGADSCVVEVAFESKDELVRKLLEDNDIEWLDGEITVRRQIASSGRSRSFVNDCPVPVSLLQSLSSRLIDIHSQHCSLLLAESSFQLSVLDAFAGNKDLLVQTARVWHELRECRSALSSLKARRDEMLANAEYIRSNYLQLDKAKLQGGELSSLEEEQRQLANAEEIKSLLSTASGLIEGDGDSQMGLVSSLRELRKGMERLSRFVPEASTLAERVESVKIELEDISSDLLQIDNSISLDPSRLQYVEDRMSLIYELMRKHSLSSVEELIALKDELEHSVTDADSISERIEALEAKAQTLYSEYTSLSSALHDSREAASLKMSERITASLHFLELESASFEVSLSPGNETERGSDNIQFLFSSNHQAPKDVRKCASGGEMSRIMLCIKALMAEYTAMPTLIFDEIDTGVSGSVADKMGQMICSMGSDMQVFAITHLPQVAAKGRAHYQVSKSVRDDKTISTIVELGAEERIMEIARMLSGSVITDAAIANAKELLS